MMYDMNFFIKLLIFIYLLSGDSGSGLFIKKGEKWLIRGIVSASLKDDTLKCDVHNYAVFTDVSQYVEWIRDYLY